MNWKKASRTDEGFLTIPGNWLLLHYYEALNALFRIENGLRMFVYIVLKDQRKGKWSDLSVTSDDGTETTIAAMAKKRLAQDERFGYLGYRVKSPLMHLTSGELIRVILADSYWQMFASYFPAQKEIVRTKLEEIGNIRNALAHFRPIKADDVEVVKQNANQVLSGVEGALTSLLKTHQIVPTNTADVWYQELRALTGPYSTFSFLQSVDENWIEVTLNCVCPHVGKSYEAQKHGKFRVGAVNSSNILKASTLVLDNVIFVSETVRNRILPQEIEKTVFRKSIHFLFSRHTLMDKYEDFQSDFSTVLKTIENETKLIADDNLARGQFVRIVEVQAKMEDRLGWLAEPNALRTPIAENDPAEYWGNKAFLSDNLLTDIESYPWMPVEISEDEIPF